MRRLSGRGSSMMGSESISNRYSSRKGERVGSLTFVSVLSSRSDNNRFVGTFLCDCGNMATYHLGRVLNGKKRTHCGCQTDRGSHRTHGMRNSPEYSSWQAMKARCLDPDNKDYPRWGAIGVTVHPDWVSSFEAFYEHVGPRPGLTTLDRIDNKKGYQPGNVRWATSSEQAANRSDTWNVEIDGVQYQSMEEAARAHRVSTTTIIRWCDGFTDKRRQNQANGGVTAPKPNCRRWRKYAN